MSMENGFELDFPGEPDAASIDELPTPAVKNTVNYWFLVESETDKKWKHRYKGHNVADAMAAYTAAILDGEEYVMLESLRENGTNKS